MTTKQPETTSKRIQTTRKQPQTMTKQTTTNGHTCTTKQKAGISLLTKKIDFPSQKRSCFFFLDFMQLISVQLVFAIYFTFFNLIFLIDPTNSLVPRLLVKEKKLCISDSRLNLNHFFSSVTHGLILSPLQICFSILHYYPF